MAEQITVTQFNERVNTIVTCSEAIRDLRMVGEISQITVSSAGHIYPTLKDNDSVVRCTMFRFAASRLKFKPQVGMKVTVYGSASYYVKGGSFGFNIESMEPYGKGEAQEKLEKLTAKLLAEGLFDQERKREIPKYPKTIGVVTSPTGAVIKDIIDTTARRYPVNILLAPATVQGDGAPESIIRGLEMLNKQDVDVIIIGRGGGSAEDLSAFNDESVVRAIVASKVPVISAVGHATDRSLADRAADRYAETPTAAAMIATPDKKDEKRNIDNISARMDRSLKEKLDSMRARFESVDSRLSPKTAKDVLDSYGMRVDQLTLRMNSGIRAKLLGDRNRFISLEGKLDLSNFRNRIYQRTMELDGLSESMDRSIAVAISSRRNRLDSFSSMLVGLDPESVLNRGYSLVKDENGKIITSATQVSPGSEITVKMRDGSAVASVKQVRDNNGKEK